VEGALSSRESQAYQDEMRAGELQRSTNATIAHMNEVDDLLQALMKQKKLLGK